MNKIAVLSDTHGLLRPEVLEILRGCDAILHGGDINRQKILDELTEIAPVFAVRGNNDKEWAGKLPETLSFKLYGIHFFMAHSRKQIPKDAGGADIVIYGHSHKYEEKYADGRLFLNPGSCGPRRFTQPITMAVLEVEEDAGAEAADSVNPEAGTEAADVAERKSFCRVKKIEISQKQPGTAADKIQEPERLPENIRQIIISAMRDTDRGRPVRAIAEKNGISEELAEQICRLYLTHPGVDADGIMMKMGI